MIKIETIQTAGVMPAIHGMRNAFNSWNKSDSAPIYIADEVTDNMALFDYFLGDEDKKLAMSLNKAGSSHSKYRRMMIVWADITAPLYWWKEFDTYRTGVEKNSCSTMHTIANKEFNISDFSTEHLMSIDDTIEDSSQRTRPIVLQPPTISLLHLIQVLNENRENYLETRDKKYWWQMIQLLPSSYNQTRTVMMSYEALASMYRDRKGHKLDEWEEFRKWIEKLEYSDLITGGEEE